MKKIGIILLSIMAIMLLVSCASTKVNRVNASEQIDLSGYWNDTDVRIVCEALINDCLSSSLVNEAILDKGVKKPVVIVGRFSYSGDEHIDTAIIANTMEAVIFNSGKLDFVAGGDLRNDLRSERLEQQGNASEETAARLANETGADFMMTGSVRTMVDQLGNNSTRTYFVSAEMTNIETNQRMWMATNSEIKKTIKRAKNKL